MQMRLLDREKINQLINLHLQIQVKGDCSKEIVSKQVLKIYQKIV